MARTIAIVGASDNRAKYGNKAVRAFKDGGWEVYPVNPHAAEVEGLRAYPSVKDIPGGLDRVSMYVPPAVGLTLLDDIAEKGAGEVFFNPGSESEAVLQAARARGINAIVACSIVNIGLRPDMYPDR